MAKKSKSGSSEEVEADSVEQAISDAAVEAAVESAPYAEGEKKVEEKKPIDVKPDLYEVMEEGDFWHNSMKTTLKKGSIINPHHNKPGTIESMQKQGVKLKKVEAAPK